MQEPIARQTRYAALAEIFREQIQSGKLNAGDRLPSFAEMRTHYGASPLTVDRALAMLEREELIVRVNGSGTFVAQKREKASAERTGRPTIALVLPNCHTSFFSPIIWGVEQACRRADHNLLLANSRGDHALEAELLASHAPDVAGLCIMACGCGNLGAFAPLLDAQVPFVLFDREVPGLSAPLITSDNELGGYDATMHLISTGRHPHLIGEAVEAASSLRDRYAGYRRALKKSGMPFDSECVYFGRLGESPELIGYVMTKLILAANPDEPVAIFALNDMVARGVYVAVREARLRIPADVAIVGFDDAIAADFDPPLSSVHQHLSLMGEETVKTLLSLVRTGTSSKSTITRVKPKLIVRNSSDENSGFSALTEMQSAVQNAGRPRYAEVA
ncbi:MAG TPA: GntR family transcriptional regulator [Capsulimonadaceae bacterium]|jgi:DNA-binding LacI/PurR family transcriptional regulator